uniref:Apple domain-containing protein n=1 Tax=Ditylenchus dipsaci TaxID=166011 RepID=A0A915CYL3_9BILA
MLLFFSLVISQLFLEFETERILCEQNNTVVLDSILFYYQRIEVTNGIVDCVERCIENAEFCKAVVFLEKIEKTNSQYHNYCQFYSSNSESRGKPIGSKSTDLKDRVKSTLVEVSEDCFIQINGHLSELMDKISNSAKRSLQLLSSEPNLSGQRVKSLNSETEIVVKELRSRINKIKEEKRDKHENQTILPRDEISLPANTTTKIEAKEDYEADRKFEVPNSSSGVQSEIPDESHIKSPAYTLLNDQESHFSPVDDQGPIRPVAVSRGGYSSDANPNGQFSNYPIGPSPYSNSMTNYPQNAVSNNARPCSARPGSNDPCAPSGWSEWSTADQCSVTCGNGVRQRLRYCLGPRKEKCKGESTKEEICELDECPKWASWSTWSQCPVTCGMGVEHRERECTPIGRCTEGSGREERTCEQKPCPSWAHWQQWSECSKTCGGGERVRKRECLHGLGNDCPGPAQEHLICNTQDCPAWTDWSAWSHCSATCGDEGTRLRQRECRYQGLISTECEGSAQDQSACQLEPCAHWSTWSKWADCSASCGHGQQLRTRECEPRGYGCTGGDREIKFCQLAVCPYFDQWSEWSGCSVTCGTGTCERTRKCHKNDPLPGAVLPSEQELNLAIDEKAALQPSENIRELEQSSLNGPSQIHEHARSLGLDVLLSSSQEKRPRLEEHTLEVAQSTSTMLERRRAPIKTKGETGLQESNGCTGPEMERKACYAGPCCDWTNWAAWGTCQMSCRTGTRTRARVCTIQSDSHDSSFASNAYVSPSGSSLKNYPTDYRPKRQLMPYQNAFSSHSYYQQRPFAGYQGSALNMGCDCPGSAKDQEPCATATTNMNQNCGSASYLRPQFDAKISAEKANDKLDMQCKWTEWSSWSRCDGSCSKATRTRDRQCAGLSKIVYAKEET